MICILHPLFGTQDLVNKLGSTDTRYETENAVSADLRTSYLFNAGVAGIEEADQLLIIGSNPRTECPVLNARIRKAHLHTGLEVWRKRGGGGG